MHTLLRFLFCSSLVLLFTFNHVRAEYIRHPPVDGDCRLIMYQHGQHQIIEYTNESGRYCLGQDFIQRKGYSLIDGRDRGDPKQEGIISIGASDTELDMRGHLLSGKPYDNVLGISTWWPDPRDYNQPLKTNPTEFLGHLYIHHGRIEVKGPGAVGMDLLTYIGMSTEFNDKLSHDGVSKNPSKIGILPEENTFDLRTAKKRTNASYWLENYPFGLTDNYPNTQHVIENMTIHAGGRAVIIAGAKNTIRNSVLEVDGDTSVLSYGPDTIIEGNTFIIHLDKKNPKGEFPAALKLHHANRAIVRNNKFIVKKGLFNSSKAEFAINLSDSKDVLIESNTLEGFDKLVRENGDTSFDEKSNTLK